MIANTISGVRVLLAMAVAALLWWPDRSVYGLCFLLTVAVIWMDGLDGFVARKLGETSKLGALVDILADRMVEQIYWVAFLAMGWVPLWIPLVVIVRGIAVDGLRSVAAQQGYTAFGDTSMMKSPLGVLLVSSRFSRWTYAVTKALAFSLMILYQAGTVPDPWLPTLATATWASVYTAVIFCVLRGLPVLIEGRRLFQPSGEEAPL
jgi:CDP-diacylglycerol--glycerol-3-phosphate 3-phosphatidyltransferase